MNKQALLTRLIEHEGLCLAPYKDTLGNLTIGIGRNLANGISEAEARYMALNDIVAAEDDLDRNIPWWRKLLNETRQQVLCEMAFNLGWPKLKGFTRFLVALELGAYEGAAFEMLNSKWATQVGNRADTLARAMQTGSFNDVA